MAFAVGGPPVFGARLALAALRLGPTLAATLSLLVALTRPRGANGGAAE